MIWNNLELPDKNIYFQDDDSVIYCADCRDILPLIPDKSIDLVLTDPPWGDRQIYIDIANGSFPKVSDGGFALLYSGANYLHDTLDIFRAAGYKYYWVIALSQPYSNYRYFATKTILRWRPLATFYKGEKAQITKWKHDSLLSPMDKKYHEWGQGIEPVIKIINAFTGENSLVLDCCVGGGTTLEASKQLGRKCIGIEIEEKYCKIAVDRLRQAVMGLKI